MRATTTDTTLRTSTARGVTPLLVATDELVLGSQS